MARPPDDGVIGRRWIHLHEEDAAGEQIYAADGPDVPLSRRPRRALSLAADGTASVGLPAADDRLSERQGRWRRDGDGVVITLPGHPPERWRAQLEAPERLRLRPEAGE